MFLHLTDQKPQVSHSLTMILMFVAKIVEIKFDQNGLPIGDAGTCDVREWAEGISYLRTIIKAEVGHKYVVEFDQCQEDPFVAQMKSSSGHCCTQQSGKISYRFKRNCIIYSLMRTCGVPLSTEI